MEGTWRDTWDMENAIEVVDGFEDARARDSNKKEA